jgi:hypothetical protein
MSDAIRRESPNEPHGPLAGDGDDAFDDRLPISCTGSARPSFMIQSRPPGDFLATGNIRNRQWRAVVHEHESRRRFMLYAFMLA